MSDTGKQFLDHQVAVARLLLERLSGADDKGRPRAKTPTEKQALKAALNYCITWLHESPTTDDSTSTDESTQEPVA